MTTTSDQALLERALTAIEYVLARGHATTGGAESSTPAHEVMRICLGSAAALVDVGQTMLRTEHANSAEQLLHEWQALIAHAKMAGRMAHQAALILASQNNIVSAQHGVTLNSDHPARPAAV